MKKLFFISLGLFVCSVVYSQTDPKAVPITVKPSPNKTLPPKQNVNSVPITVKPTQNNTSLPQNTNNLPITVKGDSLAPGFNMNSAGNTTSLPITVKGDSLAPGSNVNSVENKTLDPKQDPNSLPITVKPGTNAVPITVKPAQNTTMVQKNSTHLPITVKPGDKLLTANFIKDSLGEMPAMWKTDGMGELKLVNGQKWLRINEATSYETGLKITFPESYKVEFDVLADFKSDQTVPSITLTLFEKGEKYREPGIWFSLQPNGGTTAMPDRVQLAVRGKNGTDHNTSPAQLLTTFTDNNKQSIPVHVTLAVNKQNVKAWINDAKVYDVQEVLPENFKINRLGFEISSYGGPRVNYDYYISNIQVTAL